MPLASLTGRPHRHRGLRSSALAAAALAITLLVWPKGPASAARAPGGRASAARASAARAPGGRHPSFEIPAAADQLIVVSSPTYDPPGYLTTFRTFQRANAFSPWEPVFSTWQAETGYGHLRDVRHEGDGSTPTGVYPFGSAMYGNDANPGGLHYGFHELVCGDWWDEDPYSPQYNQFVHVPCGSTPPFASWSEALWTETAAYPYFAVIDFNVNPIVGGSKAPGSGIFLHAWVDGPTAGCVALPIADLLDVLRWLNPADHPVIEIGTDSEVGQVPPAPPPINWSVARPPGSGYWMASSAGGVAPFGWAAHLGSPLQGGVPLAAPITAIASTPDGKGYWLTSSDGQVFGYGDARFFGSPFHDRQRLDLVGIASAPSGKGYFVATSLGGVETFGLAKWYGSPLHSGHPTRVIAIAAAPDGKGYWLLAANGSVEPYGDAHSYGSPAASHLHLGSPLVGLVPTLDGRGYWLATAAGEVLPYGDAEFYGSPTGHLSSPVVGITAFKAGYGLYAAPPSLPARPTAYLYPPPVGAPRAQP
ncbi:MAG TPA: L,D-transpeptidase family protein [Acidimicrobiales bacterium]|nr:L,D-transpeptidase family protein [Acidimicrobiales bacterium]HLN06264.1 L,D-transpeptidase family protein [Acidimicrobiales bacterium]